MTASSDTERRSRDSDAASSREDGGAPVFFHSERSLTIAEVASVTGADLVDPAAGERRIRGVASAALARAGDLSFAEGRRNADLLASIQAAAVLCTPDLADRVPRGVVALISPRPQAAFAAVGRLLHPEAAFPATLTAQTSISPRATVDPTARLEEGVVVEAGAVIGPDAAIGAGTVIAPNAVIGRDCRIGRNCFIGPNVTIRYALLGDGVVIHGGTQIGQDGFGYVPGRRGPEKMPQLGRVVLQNGVEIGANSTVDRGTLGDTVIGENTKIDNLVQIAHNVRIGRNCLFASHCGISGSVTIGDNCLFGGRVGIADHVTIGSNVQLAAASGVLNDVPDGGRWGGFPAEPVRGWMRGVATLRRLAGAKPRERKNSGNGDA